MGELAELKISMNAGMRINIGPLSAVKWDQRELAAREIWPAHFLCTIENFTTEKQNTRQLRHMNKLVIVMLTPAGIG